MKSPKTKKVVPKEKRVIDIVREWIKKNTNKGEMAYVYQTVNSITIAKASSMFRYSLPTKKSAGKRKSKKV